MIRAISARKGEPEWMLEWRLEAYRHWLTMTEPTWARVNYRIITNNAARTAALLSGDVDIVTDLPPQDFFKLKEEGRVKLLEGPEVRTVFFAMDQGSDELRNASPKRCRRR